MKTAYLHILEEYHSLTNQLASGEILDIASSAKRQAELLPMAEKIEALQKLEAQITENQELLNQEDEEIRGLAAEEIKSLETQILNLEEALSESLLPKDPSDNKDCLVEMRAGAGGDESSLFAAELFRAFNKYAEKLAFKCHVVSSHRNEAGGFKEIIFEVTNPKTKPDGPYSIFKFESGVHRVQRVPETEKSGRVHTSTITVAVLPEIEEKDYYLDPKDLKIEATTSSGHGGQSVNTTYSAIRITHLPTGITAQCQDERSQAQNKEKALAVIRSRVASYYREIEEKKIRDSRKNQVGTGDRSEKIRTYNFPQDRITDHRINQNFTQINLVMEGEFFGITKALKNTEIALRKANLDS